MAFNVLLMLSSNENPHPTDEEIPYHAGECQAGGTTFVITGKVLGVITPGKRRPAFPMTSGESVVAFYGDEPLGNALLAQGIFVSYIRFNSPQGQQLFQHHALYNVNNIPNNPKGFIEVQNLVATPAGTTIDALNGIIQSGGDIDGLAQPCQGACGFSKLASSVRIHQNLAGKPPCCSTRFSIASFKRVRRPSWSGACSNTC